MSSRTDFKRHVTPPGGRSLSFWERFLITLRLDPHGRRRPPVPSAAHYTHRSVKGMVHATAEIKTVDDDVELSGTRLTLSTPGGLMAIELKGFTVPAVDGDWVEIFYAKIMTVDAPYPIYFHNKTTNTLTAIGAQHQALCCPQRPT